VRCRQDARERLSEHVAIVSFTAPVIDARPAARSPARFFDGAPPLRNQKFADSPLEGRVTSELVSEVDSGARKNQNQIFRGFWMIPASENAVSLEKSTR